MMIRSLQQTEQIQVNMEGAKDILKQVPISKADGSPAFSFRVFTIKPQGHTPYHQHPFEHLNYVIAGQGAVVKNEGHEKQEIPIQTGDFVLVLPNEVHQYKNTSDKEEFVMICAVPITYE